MAYTRVIPRDLFNEGNLLKCMGQLYLKLDAPGTSRAVLDHEGGPFVIEQSPYDGSISVVNVNLSIDGEPVRLYRPLNSRETYPLWFACDIDEDEVFTTSGELSLEFKRVIGWTQA